MLVVLLLEFFKQTSVSISYLYKKLYNEIYNNASVGDFMNVEESYEDLLDFKVVKKFMNDQLDEYNNFPGVVGMSLVLFKDAIEHGL